VVAGSAIGTPATGDRPDAPDGPDSMGREIAEGPAAVEATLAGLADGTARRAIADAGRIVLVGTGASFAMAEAAGPLFADPPAIVRESSAVALGGLDGRPFGPSDLVVAISMSGVSPETGAAAVAARQAGLRLIALTAVADSALARSADAVVVTPIGAESGAATKSALTAFAALAALAGALPADPGSAADLRRRLAVTAADLDAVLDAGALVAHARACWTLGFGPAFGVARAAALLLHEKARRSAVSCTPSEFRHGPIEAAGPEDAVVLVDAGLEPNAARTRYLDRLASELEALDVPLVTLPPADGREPGRAAPPGADSVGRAESILHALLRVQQLARVAAHVRGSYREEFLVLRAVVHAADDLVAPTGPEQDA
jgi:glutamine---fructose-6-phosphate transaminase (isomerizing)